jgi:hypothetical protein
MNKLTKGALTMVLAGSVTFSVTNALLADHSSKRLAKANALIHSVDQKIADNINHAKKSVKDEKPTTEVKDMETTLSHKIDTLQTNPKSGNKNDAVITANQQSNEKYTKRTLIIPTKTDTTTTTMPAATTLPTPSTKVSKTATTTPTTTLGMTNTSTPTTTTNHGKLVSQVVKANALSHQDKKESKGKKI